jgi:hypothetical protein
LGFGAARKCRPVVISLNAMEEALTDFFRGMDRFVIGVIPALLETGDYEEVLRSYDAHLLMSFADLLKIGFYCVFSTHIQGSIAKSLRN